MPGAAYLRSLNPQLPLPVWLLQGGGVANSFGNGLALPFLVIYLHNVRGFSLGTSGLVVAVSSAGQLAAGIFAGPLIDRFGARRSLAVGLVLQAVGYGLLPLVREPWEAFALVALEGAGSAGFWPSQSTLISRLTPAARRHAAFAQQRVTMNLGIGLGGLAAGWIAKVHEPRTFTILFVLDALTFLAYVGVLAFVRDPGVEPHERGETPASYRAVLRHRTFLGLWTLNFLFVAAGYWLTATSAFLVLATAAAILGIGECFHGPAHQALVSEIGPPHLRGRYFAVHSLSWGLAGTVGPAIGGFILAAAPFALWPLASGICLLAAAGALALERYVPEGLRRIPREDALTPTLAEAPG